MVVPLKKLHPRVILWLVQMVFSWCNIGRDDLLILLVQKRQGNEAIKGAIRQADLYIGNCHNDVTPDSISKYIVDETNIRIVKCESLASRNESCRSFKVTLKISDRQRLLSPEVWPEGIICRKFYSKRIK